MTNLKIAKNMMHHEDHDTRDRAKAWLAELGSTKVGDRFNL